MPITRRDFLRLTALVAASELLASCAPFTPGFLLAAPAALPARSTPTDFLALNRLTFGATSADRLHIAQIGLAAWIEEQLSPDAIDDLPMRLRLRNLDTLEMSAQQLADSSGKLFDDIDRETIPAQLRQATLLRQIYSQRQLFEVMVEFWNDHFNISTTKGNCFYLKTVDDREVTRKHALGSFRDLLWASSHSPAMLTYLDNQANHRGAPNENYARELMELHTVGIGGGYTQKDVMEMARCLTGWTVKEHFWTGDFSFDPALHDTGAKTVMGSLIPDAGQAEAEGVIERLAAHPNTARFVVTRLARRLLSDTPPVEIIQRASAVFLQTGGDIRAVLRVLLLDGLTAGASKYRRPVNFIVGVLRMLHAESDAGPAVQDALMHMGQLPFTWPTPDGFPDLAPSWQGNLIPRWQFAFALVRNEIDGTRVDLPSLALAAAGAQTLPPALDAVYNLLLGSTPDPALRDALVAAIRSAGANDDETLAVFTGGILSSPAYQWR